MASTPAAAKAAKVAKAVATRSRRSSSEGTTAATLLQVRVEVHLSNGTELGPPPPVDLAPGQTIPITLEATSAPFDTWSAHSEVGGSGGEDGSVETRVQSSTWGHIKASLSPLADSWSTAGGQGAGPLRGIEGFAPWVNPTLRETP